MEVHDAAMKYRASGSPVIILAGKDYGVGSPRDWVAKGQAMLVTCLPNVLSINMPQSAYDLTLVTSWFIM
jgi:Aconitase C-terminal domain